MLLSWCPCNDTSNWYLGTFVHPLRAKPSPSQTVNAQKVTLILCGDDKVISQRWGCVQERGNIRRQGTPMLGRIISITELLLHLEDFQLS